MSINPRLVVLKHFCWSYLTDFHMAYPSYLRSKDNNTLKVLLSLVAILVIFSV